MNSGADAMKGITKPIQTEREYDDALAYLDEHFDARPGTDQGNLNELYFILIKEYEAARYGAQFNRRVSQSEVLKYLMEQNKLTQTDFAKELGCSKSAVSEICHGTRTLSLKQIQKLRERFKISSDCLIEGADHSRRKRTNGRPRAQVRD